MTDIKQRRKEALALAEKSAPCQLPELARQYWPEMKKNDRLTLCPFCGKKGDKFGVRKSKTGSWYWGCQVTSCTHSIDNIMAAKHGNAVGLIMHMEGIGFHEAATKLCQLAGIEYPQWEEKPKPQPAKKTPPPTNNTSPLINIPDKGRNPWEEIYTRLTLTPQDRDTLKQQRGFSDETINLNGYRSSVSKNKQTLSEVLDLFPEEQLLETGIAVKAQDGSGIKINAQLYGYGLAKRGDSKTKDKFGWVNPILIPYIGANGRITYIRPHKCGISPKAYLRELKIHGSFYYSSSISQPYGEHLLNNRPKRFKNSCVLTEGEFKAAALHQAGIPAMAVPGIHMTRNKAFLTQLVNSLTSAGIDNIRVFFDNEDKSHKPDPWDHHDVEVYARYAAHVLRMRSFNTYYGNLPTDWRINGKADWDGRLAKLVATHGQKEGTKLARKEFSGAYFDARKYDPQMVHYFSKHEKERIISCKLTKLTYQPHIPVGGKEEERQADILVNCHPAYREELNVSNLIKSLRDTIGVYYQHTPVRQEAAARLRKLKAKIAREKDEEPDIATRAQLEAAHLAASIALKGRPEAISNFTIECEYTIRTRENNIERLFTLKNNLNQVSDYCQPEAKDLAGPQKFREFCYARGQFSFTGGEKALQLLIKDLDVASAWREIRELDTIGLDNESGLYLLGDCAITPEGTAIFPDEHNILWHEGIGYRMDPDDMLEFAHKTPPTLFPSDIGETPRQIYQRIQQDPGKEKEEVSGILQNLIADMTATVGDASGCVLVMAALAYAVAPETIHKYNTQLGIWIHGQMSAGKTETARQLMMIWGYPANYDIPTLGEGTTNVGMDRLMSQYCSWPMHLDEFREDEANKAKTASLRNAYNRQSKNKGRLDQSKKTKSYTPLTVPIVTGEGITTDAATKSRFVNVIISREKRKGTPAEQSERYKEMVEAAHQYHRIGRWIMLHRKQFAAEVMKHLDDFLHNEEVNNSINSARLRTTYGPTYGVFNALNTIFDIDLQEKHNNYFRSFLIKYIATAAEEVAQVNFVTKFWRDVTSLMTRKPSECKKHIRVAYCSFDNPHKPVIHADTHNNNIIEGSVPCVILNGKATYDIYSSDKRQRGEAPELSEQNLLVQMQQQNAWIKSDPKAKRRGHRVTLWPGEKQSTVWIMRIDLMDEATQQVFQPFLDAIIEPEPGDPFD